VRSFAIEWVDASSRHTERARRIRWTSRIIADRAPHVDVASTIAAEGMADGLLIWIGNDADERAAPEIFAACQSARMQNIPHLAICHGGAPLAGFSRSLALERQFASVLLIERTGGTTPADVARELAIDVDEFHEVRLTGDGGRWEPRFALASPRTCPEAMLGPRDLVLVTGGTKGIGAECALRLGVRTGAALAFAGRSSASDPAVAATLARARAQRIRCLYAVADVTDQAAMAAAAARASDRFGPITALLHAAGFNETQLFHNIEAADFLRIMAPKTVGLRIAVDAAGPRLRRIVTFGSILGCMGLKGETHYALANAWQSAIAEEIASRRPQCKVLSLEWSIWDGAGMGHRRGVLDALVRFGVDAVALDDGLDAFERLAVGGAAGALIVTSRFGPPSYVGFSDDAAPPLIDGDELVLFYPGLEAVIRTTLSRARIGGDRLTRSDGIRAMSALAGALLRREVVLRSACGRSAIALPERDGMPAHLIALVRMDGCVDVRLRFDRNDGADIMQAVFSARTPIQRLGETGR
jgi:enediyne polyketide synthase